MRIQLGYKADTMKGYAQILGLAVLLVGLLAVGVSAASFLTEQKSAEISTNKNTVSLDGSERAGIEFNIKNNQEEPQEFYIKLIPEEKERGFLYFQDAGENTSRVDVGTIAVKEVETIQVYRNTELGVELDVTAELYRKSDNELIDTTSFTADLQG